MNLSSYDTFSPKHMSTITKDDSDGDNLGHSNSAATLEDHIDGSPSTGDLKVPHNSKMPAQAYQQVAKYENQDTDLLSPSVDILQPDYNQFSSSNLIVDGFSLSADIKPLTRPRVEHRLPVWRKIAYGMGGPPMQMCSNSMGFYFTIFLLEVAGIPAHYNAVIQFSARAWDAITDPLVGYLVTKTKTPCGQMRPWILISAPFGCFCFFLLYYVPDIPSQDTRFVYYFFVVLSLMTTLTTFHVPYSSMTMTLTDNMRDRDLCSAFRMGFELIGVLIGSGGFGAIISSSRLATGGTCGDNSTIANITDTQRQEEKNAYMLASGAIIIIYLICALTVFFGSEEKFKGPENKENYCKSLQHIMSFTPYVKLMTAFLCVSLGLQIIQGNMAMYVTHSLNLSSTHMATGIAVLLTCAIMLIPFIQFLIVRLGKKTTFVIGILNIYPLLVAMVYMPSDPPLFIYYGLLILSSFTISVAFLLPWSMLPDVIDAFMLKHGVRREAAFYSFYVFFNKFAVGISLGLSNIVLGFVGYESGEACQSPAVGVAMRYLMGPAAISCFTGSLIILYFYPINDDYRKWMKVELDRNNETKPDTFISTQTMSSSVSVAHRTQSTV